MDTTKAITHVSLCAGYGGIDLGLSRAIPSLRTVAFSEIEAFACANLVSKMEAGLLDAAPIWTNLKTFPWDGFLGKVDILSGGFPCQPFSSAGKRDGDEDPRHLFPYILDGIRRCQPSVIFLENVEGILSSKLTGDNWEDQAGTPVLLHILRELERVGYKATAGIFSAREVGAPHQRKRVFILAYRKSEGLERYNGLFAGCGESRRDASEQKGQASWGNSGGNTWPSRPGQPQFSWEPPRVVGNTQHDGSHQRGSQTRGTESCGEQGWMQESEGGSASMGDTENQGCRRLDDEQGEVSSRETRGHLDRASSTMGNGNSINWSAPSEGWQHDSQARPASEELADNLRGRLPHATNEQRNSGTDDHAVIRTRTSESGGRQTQQPLGRDTDEPPGGMDYAELSVTCDNRTDELRLLGNGVVPATAERAFRTLLAELIP